MRKPWARAVTVIDARTGDILLPEHTLRYPDGTGVILLAMRVNWITTDLTVITFDHEVYTPPKIVRVPLHYFHPGFPFQWIAFIPS